VGWYKEESAKFSEVRALIADNGLTLGKRTQAGFAQIYFPKTLDSICRYRFYNQVHTSLCFQIAKLITMFQTITPNLAIGSISQPEDLQGVAEKGYKTIIDLCTATECNQLDASMVQGLALKYVNVPISPKNLSLETLGTFKKALESSPQPTYVRCASALRASVFSLLVLASEEGWTEAQYLEKFQSLGIIQKSDCPMGAFAHSYFEQKV
jgi:protein tyrosine phosphatase (PTP) superfamily phosphohydrolase (DUF442 family)